MSLVFTGELPRVVEDWLAERRRLGLDRRDEVWEGSYRVMAPAPESGHSLTDGSLMLSLGGRARQQGLHYATPFNLGRADDYRIPDGGVLRDARRAVYLDTAAMVVEVLSPGDETFVKLPFYARHGVDEVLVTDPATHRPALAAARGCVRRDRAQRPARRHGGRAHGRGRLALSRRRPQETM